MGVSVSIASGAAITDNAEPRMNVVFFRRDSGEKVCEAPVFGEDASATDNSLIMADGWEPGDLV